MKVLENLNGDYLACAFDVGKPTWRHQELQVYKQNRKKTDTELTDQIPHIRKVIESMNIPILEYAGYEADDVVGTISEWIETGVWSDNDLDLIIVSGDNDILQLVGGKTRVWLPKKSFNDMVLYDDAEVIKKYNFEPEFLPDYKALVGDASDNIPGVAGIGAVSGEKLISKYKTIDEVFKNLDKVDTRSKNKLEGQEEIAHLSKRIATIVKDVPVEVELSDCDIKDFEMQMAVGLFKEYGFRSQIAKLNKILGDGVEQSSVASANPAQLGLFEDVNSESSGSVLVEYTAGFPTQKDFKDNLFFTYNSEKVYFLADKSEKIFEVDFDIKVLEFFKNIEVETFGFALKLFYKKLISLDSKVGFEISRNIYDLQILASLITGDRKSFELDAVAFEHLKVEIPEFSEEGLGKNAKTYLEVLKSLMKSFKEKMEGLEFDQKAYIWDKVDESSFIVGKEGLPKHFNNPLGKLFVYIENSVVFMLAEIELAGITLDVKKLNTIEKEFKKSLEKITKEIYDVVGHEFNINSPQQLSQVLFEELGLPKTKRRKVGYATDESSLASIKDFHDLPELILKYRELAKLLNTYVNILKEEVEEDGKIRTTYNQFGAATGRLSSSDPNLQTIPIRSDYGKKIRTTLMSESSNILVAADYSQVELRVLAYQSEDKKLIESFKKNIDVHAQTAANLFNKKVEKVSSDERRVGKTVNFGIVYGQTPYGLSAQLDIPFEEAAEYIKKYFEIYTGVEKYLTDTINFAKEYEYVETIFGRRRYIYNISSRNRNVQMAAQREAINMPIQGAATGDIMKLAMINVRKLISEKYSDYASIILQIHDELVFEIKGGGRLSDFVKDVKKSMESVVGDEIYLKVDVEAGKNLNDMESVG